MLWKQGPIIFRIIWGEDVVVDDDDDDDDEGDCGTDSNIM